MEVADVENDSESTFSSLQDVISNLLSAIRTGTGDFRVPVAPLTGVITLLLKAECEEYGMSKELYTKVMKYSRKFPQKYRVILEMGNFYFEGTAYGTNKKIVLSVGDGNTISESHIPLSFLPEVIAEIGGKRKASQRGPGKDSYKSARACVLTSQQLSQPIIDLIESKFQSYGINKKNELIIAAIKTLMRKYEIKSEEIDIKKFQDADARVVFSLNTYLVRLQKYGSKFGQHY
jgi:hypothetical protein